MFEKARIIRDYGIDRNNFRDYLNEINPDCDVNLEGYGALMNEVNSLIGLKQMDNIDRLLKKQRMNAIAWKGYIDQISNVEPLKITPNSLPNNWVYGLLSKDRIQTI